MLRLFAEGRSFFLCRNKNWNIFEAIIVTASIVELFSEKTSSIFPVLRLIRLLRAIRLIKVMPCLRTLRLMLVSMQSCLGSLMWAILLLFLVMYLVAMYFEYA